MLYEHSTDPIATHIRLPLGVSVSFTDLAFVAVAETGSFTKAAHQLSTGLAVISHSVTELEGHLRTRLLNR